MKPQRFLAYDPVNEEYERFDTIEDAREYLETGFLADPNEGYHPDTEDFQIYELRETVELNIVDCIEEYENRDDWPYPEFDEICEHKFVDARKKFSFKGKITEIYKKKPWNQKGLYLNY